MKSPHNKVRITTVIHPRAECGVARQLGVPQGRIRGLLIHREHGDAFLGRCYDDLQLGLILGLGLGSGLGLALGFRVRFSR